MLEALLHEAARDLLDAAIRIAPVGARDWGRAMRGELGHVEGGWAAMAWSLGGAGVLARHALLSLLIPGSRGSSGELFARRVSLRKVAFVASAAYVLAALLFFAAPPFRQGLRVSLAAWHVLFRAPWQSGQPALRNLAQRAQARRDAEGLVFVAVRLRDSTESARLAEEVAHLNPSLLWACAVVAIRHPRLPEIREWVSRLERWDPQNALFPLIAAESIDLEVNTSRSGLSPVERQREWMRDELAWRDAMAAAFASRKFDDYLDRLRDLDRTVARRYGLNDPYVLLLPEGVPILAASDAHKFAGSLLRSGQNLESRGNREGAAEKFWTVARFGQLIDSQAHTPNDHQAGAALQSMAYKQLGTVSEQEGSAHEAALFAYLAAKFNPAARERERLSVFGPEIFTRNALVLQISGLMTLIFGALLATSAVILLAARRRNGPVKSAVTVAALTSAVGVLLSSATVYLTYRPYWYIFQAAILKGETSQVDGLKSFWMAARYLPGPRGSQINLTFPVYFWTGVTLLSFIVLTFFLLKHFVWRAQAEEPSPRVP